jgi:cellulase/cellobiase CelA1
MTRPARSRVLVGLLLLPLAATALALALAAPASAVEDDRASTTWGVVPSSEDGPNGRAAFEYTLDAGSAVSDYVGVVNYATKPLKVSVYASDAFTTADGGFDLLPRTDAPVDVGSWTTVKETRVTVPARSRVDVPFRIDVPENATPGDHVGGIVAAVTTAADADAESNVDIDRRIGARVYLRVAGDLAPSLTVRDVSASYDGTVNPFGRGRVTLTYTVANEGNVRLVGAPTAVVEGPFGAARASAVGEPLPEILPGNAIVRTLAVDDVWPLGRLDARVEVAPAASGDQALPGTLAPYGGSTTVWAVSWSLVALLLVAIVSGLVAWGRRRRRHDHAEEPSEPTDTVEPVEV